MIIDGVVITYEPEKRPDIIMGHCELRNPTDRAAWLVGFWAWFEDLPRAISAGPVFKQWISKPKPCRKTGKMEDIYQALARRAKTNKIVRMIVTDISEPQSGWKAEILDAMNKIAPKTDYCRMLSGRPA